MSLLDRRVRGFRLVDPEETLVQAEEDETGGDEDDSDGGGRHSGGHVCCRGAPDVGAPEHARGRSGAARPP